ncbi:DUF4333 domain-containing protein [Nocardioides sp. R-C-SC26]|uniref:DUF4333 domain-containing protein n=1 Tax=Nocardioides sp. R-C-SC26 TaxID=2870414 RepID=UPI001E4E5994|nr:DUF4333 domain-containing protein [Nocardioides sp. R-C-SC26]
MKRALTASVLAGVLMSAAGCGSDDGAPGEEGFDRAGLESAVLDRMTEEATADRGAPDAVDCDGGLDPDSSADEAQRCVATIGDQRIGLIVLPGGGERGWDWQFDPGLTMAAADLEQRLEAGIAEESGSLVDSVMCPEDLPGLPEATLTCEVTTRGATYPVTVTVTDAVGSELNFRFVVEEQS